MNRRDFFQSLPPPAAGPPSPGEVALLRVGRRAMATHFEILLPYGQPAALDAAQDALDLIDRLEDQLTVFREKSEVCRLNRLAPLGWVPVERGLFELLQTACRLHQETDGAFDVTAGPLIKAWGFYRRQGRVPGEEELREALARVGMRHVRLDPARSAVRYDRPGVEVNFGAIGKGYALDRVKELLGGEWGVRCGLVHGGSSSVLSLGVPPDDPRGWEVAVKHPWEPGRTLAVVRLRGGALGTSAATYQHFEYNKRRLGHILDPRTGRPAEGVASATVLAPTAAEADALSTAFYTLGVPAARAYCERRADVAAVLLPEGADRPVALNLGPADCAAPAAV